MAEEYTEPMVKLIYKGGKSSVLHRNKSKLGVIEIPSMLVISNYMNRHRPQIPAYVHECVQQRHGRENCKTKGDA